MVQLKLFAILFLFVSQRTRSELVSEESKKILLKKSSKFLLKKPFECDLVLQAQQEAMMYPSENSPKVYVSLDSYTWPKTKEGHVIVPYYISRGSHYCK